MNAPAMGIWGMRGTVGGTLTPMAVNRLASAFSAWLKQSQTPVNGTHFRVVVGRDSRASGAWVRDAAAAGMIASGIEVIDLDVVTTPGASMMTSHLGVDGGCVVTASNRPAEWNGVRFLDGQGAAMSAEAAGGIIERYAAGATDYVRVEKLIPPSRNSETHALHVKRVLGYMDALGISSKRYKVVLDTVNGAGCVCGAVLLSKLGCRVVHMNDKPDGRFAHDPDPAGENLARLAQEVRRQKADVGFATDSDATRLGIVDEAGRWIGGEHALALAAKMLLSRKAGVVVADLCSGRMLDDIANAAGGRVVRTGGEEASVVRGMIGNRAAIGGQSDGRVIDLRMAAAPDSLVGMAYVLQLMASTGKTVGELVAETPHYQKVEEELSCGPGDAERVVQGLREAFAGERIDTQDGIRIDWELGEAESSGGPSWAYVRASEGEGTMQIVAEAKTELAARARVDQVRQAARRASGRD